MLNIILFYTSEKVKYFDSVSQFLESGAKDADWTVSLVNFHTSTKQRTVDWEFWWLKSNLEQFFFLFKKGFFL